MRRHLRWPLAALAGAIVAVSVLVIPASSQGPVSSEVGTLFIHLNSDGDRVVFDPVAAGPNLVQTLSQSNCKLSSTGDSLVAIVGSGQANKKPFAGLKDHRIGVGQNGEGNGEPCARINKDLGQVLTVNLTGTLADQAISYAEIDLGFKFNGDAVLQLKKGGPSGTLVDTVTVPCSGLSDCGPDSGGSDNERVVLYLTGTTPPPAGHWQAFAIDGAFDTIVISPGTAASNGSVSLEAGLGGSLPGPLGASLGTGDSLFQLAEVFDGEIDCGDTVTLGGGDDPTFQTTRANDTNGGCKGPEDGLLFNFDAGVEGDRKFVDFVTEPVDASSATVAQFLEVITWTFDDPPAVPGEDQFRTLSYDDHVGAGERVMPWCLKDPRLGGSLPSPLDPATVLPAGHTSCLIESTSYVSLGDFVSVDFVYNIGDGKRWN
jgi:hypothetical protein